MTRSNRLFALYMDPNDRSPISETLTTKEWFDRYKWSPLARAFMPVAMKGDEDPPDVIPGDYLAIVLGEEVYGPVEILDVQRTLSSNALELHYEACPAAENFPRSRFPKKGHGLVDIERYEKAPIIEPMPVSPDRDPTTDEMAAFRVIAEHSETLRLMPVLFGKEPRMALISVQKTEEGEEVALILAILTKTFDRILSADGTPFTDHTGSIEVDNMTFDTPTLN